MIRNILVGYGGSRGSQVALRQAVEIAAAATARIRLALVESAGDSAAETALVMDRSPEQMMLAAAGDQGELEPDSYTPTPALQEGAQRCDAGGVTCTMARYFGDPAERLLDLSRLSDLVVIGRRGDGGRHGRSALGRNARRLAAEAIAPTLFADREYLELRSATLYYEPRPEGGRALAEAAELCSILNVSLNVMCAGHGRVTTRAAESEARFALRAYHLDGELVAGGKAGPEAVQNAAMLWGDPLLVVPVARTRGLFPDYSVLRAAMDTPNTTVLLVP